MLKKLSRFLGFLVFGVVVTLFPLIALWKVNLGQISASAVWPSMGYTSLCGVVIFMAWFAASHSPEKAALLTTLTSLYLFSYGHLVNLTEFLQLGSISIGYVKLFFAASFAFILGCVLVFRLKQRLPIMLLVLPVALLVSFNLVSIAPYILQPAALPQQAAEIPASPGDDEYLPDIYFIVLDEYARADVLSDVLNFDNSHFLESLGERGFFIPRCAFSNYDGTALSMASTLNYETLDRLGVRTKNNGGYNDPADSLIQNNLASQTFRSYGYQFVTGRGYGSFNDIASADVYLNYAIDLGIGDDFPQKRFGNLYLNTTVIRLASELYRNNPEKYSWMPVWLVTDWESDKSFEWARFWYLQNNYMLEKLKEIPEWPGHYFVYAHINAPHGPHVYYPDGSFRYPTDDRYEKQLYSDSVTYINQQVLEVVDALQEKSSPAPIIIIQADHGLRRFTTGLEMHKILSAYYLPGELTLEPYDTITPVNNFRLVLRNYFDPSVELLPDTLHVKFLNNYEDVAADCGMQQP